MFKTHTDIDIGFKTLIYQLINENNFLVLIYWLKANKITLSYSLGLPQQPALFLNNNPNGLVSPLSIKPRIFSLLVACVNHHTMEPLQANT